MQHYYCLLYRLSGLGPEKYTGMGQKQQILLIDLPIIALTIFSNFLNFFTGG